MLSTVAPPFASIAPENVDAAYTNIFVKVERPTKVLTPLTDN